MTTSTHRPLRARGGFVVAVVVATSLAVSACTSDPTSNASGDALETIPLPTSGSRLDGETPGQDPTSPGPGDVGTSSEPAGPGATSSPAAGPTPTETPSIPTRTVDVIAPGDGQTVSGPVQLEVAIEGFSLVELTGDMAEDKGHLYVFVDEEPPSERIRLPQSDRIFTSSSTTVDIGILAPGPHTITVVATHPYPIPFEPRVEDTVMFTVDG